MAGLVSDAELNALEEVVELGMVTPIAILSLSNVARGDDDPERVWAQTAATTGWLWEPPEFPTGGDVGGVAGDANKFRLFLRKSVEVEPGDRVGVEGEIYEVTGSNKHDTYKPTQRLALRRLE